MVFRHILALACSISLFSCSFPPPLTQTAKSSFNQTKFTPEALAEKRKAFFSNLRQQRLKEKADFKIQDHVDAVWGPPQTRYSKIVNTTHDSYGFPCPNGCTQADIGKPYTMVLFFAPPMSVSFSPDAPSDEIMFSSTQDGSENITLGKAEDSIMCSYAGSTVATDWKKEHFETRFKVASGGTQSPIRLSTVLKSKNLSLKGITCAIERQTQVETVPQSYWGVCAAPSGQEIPCFNYSYFHTLYPPQDWYPNGDIYLVNTFSSLVDPSYHVDLTVDPKLFYPGSTQTEWPNTINFHLDTGPNEETWVEVYQEIVEEDGDISWADPVLAQVAEPDGEGSRTVVWDGRDSQGNYLPPGNYVAFAYSYNWDDYESFSIALPPVVATPTPQPTPSPDTPLCDEASVMPDQTTGLAGIISSTQFPLIFTYRVTGFQTLAAKDDSSGQAKNARKASASPPPPLAGTLNAQIQAVQQQKLAIRTEINRLKQDPSYSQDVALELLDYAAHEEYLQFLEEASLYQLSLDSTVGLIDAANTFADLLHYYETLLESINTQQFVGISRSEAESLTQKVENLIPKLRPLAENLKDDLNQTLQQEAGELKELTELAHDMVLTAVFDAWVEEGLMDPITGELTPPADDDFSIQNLRECYQYKINCPTQRTQQTQQDQSSAVRSYSRAREVDLQALVQNFKNRKTPLADFLQQHKARYLDEATRILSGYDKASWALVGAVEKRALIAAFSEVVFAVLPESVLEYLPVGKGFRIAEASIPQLAKAIKRFEQLKDKYKLKDPDLAAHINNLIIQLRKRLEALQKCGSPCAVAGKYYSQFKNKFVDFDQYLLHKPMKDLDKFLREFGHLKGYSIYFDKNAVPDFRKIKLNGQTLSGSELKKVMRAETQIVPSTDYQELVKKYKGKKPPQAEVEKAIEKARETDKRKAINALSKDPNFINELNQTYPGKKVTQELIEKYLKGFNGHHSVYDSRSKKISFQFVKEDIHEAFKHEGSFSLISKQ